MLTEIKFHCKEVCFGLYGIMGVYVRGKWQGKGMVRNTLLLQSV